MSACTRSYAANLSIASAQARRQGSTEVEAPVSHDKVPFVAGLENPTEGSYNLVRRLVRDGYSDEDIAKVMGGNALRVLGQVWS